MPQPTTAETLARLRAAADQIHAAWPVTHWTKDTPGASEPLELHGNGHFSGLVFDPGVDLRLRCRLDLPARVANVPIEGDALELSIFSIYPMVLYWNERPIFEDPRPPVAAGPALVRVIPRLQTGDNGELLAHIHVPNNQTIPWFQLYFTTPRLRARFELFDVAWAQLALADALAVTPDEREHVADAAEVIPQDPLAADDAALQTAFQQMAERLSPLTERVAGICIHIIGHSHIDMNWLWTWPDTVEVIKRDFRSILALMDDYPELTFTHSQPATYEVIRRQEPGLFARVLEHIRSGRWEPASMTWVEGDENMASGEAAARQLLEGVTYSREVLNAQPDTFLAPDTFGHPGNLPQLASSAGAQRYYHHRCNPGQADLWPAYWWEGQDGTRILAISTHTYNGNIRARDLAEAAIRAHRHGHRVGLHFHGIGDHGGGPARHNLDALRRFADVPFLPSARCSTLAEYTRDLLASGVALPVHHGESSTIFEGCYTTHADTKRYNRDGENMLCTADTLAALAGLDCRLELRAAWRKLLFNQFHDIFDGSAIHETYEQNAQDFAELEATSRSVIHRSLPVLTAGLAAGSIAVTNPLGWEREEWVVVPGKMDQDRLWLVGEHGHRTVGQRVEDGLGFVARVSAFATVGYQIQTDDRQPLPGALQAEPCFAPTDNRKVDLLSAAAIEPPYLRIETSVFRIYLRRDSGIIVSLFDKRVGRELVGYGMRRGTDYLDTARADLALNVLQLLDEHPHGMSAWHLDEVHTKHSLLRGAVSEVVESGPARLVVEVRHQVRASLIVQRISFYRDLPRIDVQTSLDWQELGSVEAGVPNLKVAFTAHLPEAEAWFETPFAAVKRPCDGQEVPALRWADVGGNQYGIALLNDSKYGYDALGTRLRLTLVRSAYEPDRISDVGRHDIRYSLVPHLGNWRDAGIVRLAAGFNQPLIAHEVEAVSHAEDRASTWRPELVDGSSVVIACLKRSHAGSGRIVRLYESAGRTVEAELNGLPADARVWETNIVEDRIAELEPRNGSMRLTFRPWQVRTLLVEN